MSDLSCYDYKLPNQLIAQQPLTHRTDARLLVLDRHSNTIDHSHVRDLPGLLQPGDCLLLNDTRVIPAQLVGYRTQTGGRWTGLYLSTDARGGWRLLCKTRGKLKPGETVTLQDPSLADRAVIRMLVDLGQGQWIAMPEPAQEALTLLQQVGRVPLPHYIRSGHAVGSDKEHYQTVFASQPGAVAAPTAGLHFTQHLLQQLQQAGITTCCITLHVGIGTFQPISASSLDQHKMHSEWGQISSETVNAIKHAQQSGGRIIAVGTTTVRVLESVAAQGELQPWQGQTNLFIRPPYKFQVVDALLTNFHLPKSTLLILVRTFGGDHLIRRAYQAAIDEGYRFFSYGDAMLIF